MINFKNVEKKNKLFTYQNLSKSQCFNTNFTGAGFDFVCFRGAQMKACVFNEATFRGTEFVGTNLKDSKFKKALLENCLFEGVKLEGTDFKEAIFKHVIFVGTSFEGALNLNLDDPNITVYDKMPELEISDALRTAVEKVMLNPFVKKSRVLDTKDKTMNTISVMILLERFEEEQLIRALNQLETVIDRDFYTLSYITKAIAKLTVGAGEK